MLTLRLNLHRQRGGGGKIRTTGGRKGEGEEGMGIKKEMSKIDRELSNFWILQKRDKRV